MKKIYNELKALSDEKRDTLIKTYDQLQSIIIGEIFLVNNRMLSFIVHRLHVIKQVHKEFMVGLDVVMTTNFDHIMPIQYSWIFKLKTNKFDILGTNFWNENIKCYELKQVLQ
jgi:hypothetical protein